MAFSKKYLLDDKSLPLDKIYRQTGPEGRMCRLLEDLRNQGRISVSELATLAQKHDLNGNIVGPEIISFSTGYLGYVVVFEATADGPDNVFLTFQRVDSLPSEEVVISPEANARVLDALSEAGLWRFRS